MGHLTLDVLAGCACIPSNSKLWLQTGLCVPYGVWLRLVSINLYHTIPYKCTGYSSWQNHLTGDLPIIARMYESIRCTEYIWCTVYSHLFDAC